MDMDSEELPEGEQAPVNPEELSAMDLHAAGPAPRTIRQPWMDADRPPVEQFRELLTEAKACQYDLLKELAEEVYGRGDIVFPRSEPSASWNLLDRERVAFAGAVNAQNGGGRPLALYGHLFQSAMALDMEQHTVTTEEAEHHNRQEEKAAERYPMRGIDLWEAGTVISRKRRYRVSRSRICSHWVDLFITEVNALLGEHPDGEHLAGLAELHDGLKAFEIGSKEGRPMMERLRGEVKGEQVIAAYGRHREMMLSRMEELRALKAPAIAGNDAAAQMVASTAAPSGRLKWKSSTAAFAHIFRTLAARGYFDLPRKGGKEGDFNNTEFARILLQAFDVPGKDGASITVEALRSRLSEGGPGKLADAKAGKIQIPGAGELIVPDASELE